MGVFDKFKNRKKVIDLTGGQVPITEESKPIEELEINEDRTETKKSPFNFLSNLASSSSSTSSSEPTTTEETTTTIITSVEEKKKKLSEILKKIDERIERNSSDIYKLQQRIEVLERKLDVRG